MMTVRNSPLRGRREGRAKDGRTLSAISRIRGLRNEISTLAPFSRACPIAFKVLLSS